MPPMTEANNNHVPKCTCSSGAMSLCLELGCKGGARAAQDAGGPIQTVRLTFSAPLRGHLAAIASAAVPRCVRADRLLRTTVRDLSFFPVSGLQDNFGTLYRFNSPNQRVKINKLVVEALYRDGLIPFTSLNALGPITSKPSNIVMWGNFHHFLKEEMSECSAFRPPGSTKRMKRHSPNSITKDLLVGGGCSVNSCTITNIRDIYFWFRC